MRSRRVRIAPGGRVVIPAEYRKALGVEVGDQVMIELKGDEVRLRSRQAAISKVQAMVRKHIPDETRSLAWLDALELDVRPFDRELAHATGALLPGTRGQGSLGDRACLALARALGATALTTDRAWRGVDVGVAIEVIR